ncbi:MAG: AAA family ATPase [Polyangiaceae bacterium]|nr:AAA family ATPase [Polyangiaceae bacterium]
MTRLSPDLAERVLATHPMPIADAVAALLAADSAFEMRDRVVEVFRAEIRLLSALVLAARLQIGTGPGGDAAQVPELLRGLRSRGLTDGQWVAMLREVLRPWSSAKQGHPLPELVGLVHARKSELVRLFDELLVMRKSETVAHGASGTRAALEEILARRVPQLARTLELLDPIWASARLCLPLVAQEDGTPQSAWLLMGSTPHRGRFRKIELTSTAPLPAGEALLVDKSGEPLVALHPIAMVRKPSPDVTEEIFLLDGGTKRGAIYVAFPSMAEHRETDAWGAIEGALTDAEPPSEQVTKIGADRPYRGLSSFGPDDSTLFFGREEQTEALANRIRRNGFITVTGPSGSGKTSLLRAGVLPILRDATTTFVRPGADPIASLAARLAASLDRERSIIEEQCREDPDALARLVDDIAHDAELTHVLVVDQGEEILTLCGDASVREAFAAILVKMAALDRSIRVVFGVREDFFGRLATIGAFREIYSRNVEVVTTPDRMALIRTLVAPAQLFGYTFDDEELVTAMVDEVTDAPAALALLQFCADRLWEQRDRKWKRLTWDAYRAMGGVAGALASHADRVLASMSNAERATSRALFLRLVSGERTRAVVGRAELLDGLRDPDAGARALDALVAARLVTVADDASGQPMVEIVHEALIKHWKTLDRWLGEDEEGQKLAHAMRQAAREWNTRKRARDLVWRGDLLDELRRYRRKLDEPLAGVEAAFAEASEAESRRGRRWRVGLIASALTLSTGFSVFALWQWRRTETARVEAETARAATAREKVQTEIRGLVAEARGHEPKGRSGHALALLRAASSLEAEQGETGSTELSLELERLSRAGAGGIALVGHTSGVYRSCLPPDADRVITSSFDETMRIWERSTGRLLHTLPSPGFLVRALACSPDGQSFVAGASDARGEQVTLATRRVDDGAVIHELKGPSVSIDYVEFIDDGGRIVSFGQDGKLWFFDARNGEVDRVLDEPNGGFQDYETTPDGAMTATVGDHGVDLWLADSVRPARTIEERERIASVALSDDGTRLAYSTLEGGVVPIIDTATGEIVKRIKPAGTLGVAEMRFAPGGNRLVTSGPQGMDVWDAKTGERLQSLRIDPLRTSFHISPDGTRLLTLRSGIVGELWDLETGARLAGLTGHDAEIEAVAFSPDGKTIVTGSLDKTARVYDVSQTILDHFVTPHRYMAQIAAVTADGRYVASATGESPVLVHPTTSAAFSPEPIATVTSDKKPRSVVFSPDGGRLAVGFAGARNAGSAPSKGEIRIIELGTSERAEARDVAAIAVDADPSSIVWSPDGSWIAASVGPAVQIFDASGAPRASCAPGTTNAGLLAFDPESERLVVTYFDGTANVVAVPSGQIVANLPATRGPATDIEFSPDGASLAIADNERVRWFDTQSWQFVEARGHEQAIVAIAFSPDGSRLATGSADQTIRLHVRSGDAATVLRGHTSTVQDLVFSSDGARLLSASDDGTARVWDVALATPLDILEPRGEQMRLARFTSDGRIVAVGGRSVAVLRSPPADRSLNLVESGSATNLRVCRGNFEVVSVAPAPSPDTVWANTELCTVH